jgi:hypothetical protein
LSGKESPCSGIDPQLRAVGEENGGQGPGSGAATWRKEWGVHAWFAREGKRKGGGARLQWGGTLLKGCSGGGGRVNRGHHVAGEGRGGGGGGSDRRAAPDRQRRAQACGVRVQG